ncbi:disulfide bond formation protein [Azotobacter vinelandii CA]|uniref:Disulfide bond formation protein B n=2 Tax=Azotobacter vinelandii TaxID=354 RepID=C1DJ42_AZOVD|nr:disulfide bond formation protein B [Azotobacter vinelandii]ACO80861.1 disulfide bond formation protein [Azotobacter vinelandii DJ]AGK13407.1 disulfide bond formation protein [Azotobacter vinelandii CA]AGK17786.1 disulfide bond formation protein [Azotobacter vinelandii CA6]WKN21656.1 disulfide bond formation protein B [Azotobacter vinelandii]SFX01523.1 Thiol:disulfide interchange protein DsbB [Azotobacter vinelandii]
MNLASPRSLFLLAFLGCVALLGGALYLEHGVGLEPCPLCIVQRIFVILFGLICLVAALHGPALAGQRLYAGFALLAALGGAATAGRQVWLQNIPPEQLPSCLPSLEYMLEALPFQEIVRQVLHGTADCAEVGWTLFGMSLPEWSLLAFVAMLLFALLQLLRRA